MRTGFSATELGLPEQVCCPFCQRTEFTRLYSPFGSQLSVSTYWCERCRTAFEWLKRRPGDDLPLR